jgi:hypothetical protein
MNDDLFRNAQIPSSAGNQAIRYSLRTLFLLTTAAAILAAILSDRTAVQFLVMFLLSPPLLLLALGMERSLKRGRVLGAVALLLVAVALLAICILAMLKGVPSPIL